MLVEIVEQFWIHWFPLVLGVAVFALFLVTRKRSDRLPPGPAGLPLIGCVLSMRSKDHRATFKEMREAYGDIFSFYMGRQLNVVVCGYDALREVFVKKAALFSERPNNFVKKTLRKGKGVVFANGDAWKEIRKFTIEALGSLGFGRKSHESNIHEEVSLLIEEIETRGQQPTNIKSALFNSLANIMCQLLFGRRFDHNDEKFKSLIHKINENFRLLNVASVVNFFPLLNYLPGDPFKQKKITDDFTLIINFMRDQVNDHKVRPTSNDFVGLYLQEMQRRLDNETESKLTEDQLPVIMVDLFIASFEVTGNTLYWAVLFMMRYPDVLSKVQTELDNHVMADSRPSLADLPRLPYTEATIMEIQRLADVAPFSLPHTANVDTIVNGLLIPKGSNLIPNINSVLSEGTLWKYPKEFCPERFLDDDGNRVKPEAFIPFFIGRRACLGESLAKMELFLIFSTLCQRYSFLSPPNDVVSTEGILGLSHCPKPYKVQFVPRLKCQK